MSELSELPVWLQAFLFAVVLAQLSLYVYTAADLARRPTDSVRFELKWVWLVVIFLTPVSFVGPIVYLVAGRKPAVVAQAPRAEADSSAAQTAVDTLYGPGDAR